MLLYCEQIYLKTSILLSLRHLIAQHHTNSYRLGIETRHWLKIDRNECLCRLNDLGFIEDEDNVFINFPLYLDIIYKYSIVANNFYTLLQMEVFPLRLYIRDIILFCTNTFDIGRNS